MQHVCINWFRKNETTPCFCGQLPIVANQSSPNWEKILWTFDIGAELKQRRFLSEGRQPEVDFLHSLAVIERLSIMFASICTTWPSFPFACRLLFIISTHKLVVSPNFLSIRIFRAVFICSFSILNNSELESDFCRLPYTWSLNSLFSPKIFGLIAFKREQRHLAIKFYRVKEYY